MRRTAAATPKDENVVRPEGAEETACGGKQRTANRGYLMDRPIQETPGFPNTRRAAPWTRKAVSPATLALGYQMRRSSGTRQGARSLGKIRVAIGAGMAITAVSVPRFLLIFAAFSRKPICPTWRT
jgi:hypothetical protein